MKRNFLVTLLLILIVGVVYAIPPPDFKPLNIEIEQVQIMDIDIDVVADIWAIPVNVSYQIVFEVCEDINRYTYQDNNNDNLMNTSLTNPMILTMENANTERMVTLNTTLNSQITIQNLVINYSEVVGINSTSLNTKIATVYKNSIFVNIVITPNTENHCS